MPKRLRSKIFYGFLISPGPFPLPEILRGVVPGCSELQINTQRWASLSGQSGLIDFQMTCLLEEIRAAASVWSLKSLLKTHF